MSAKSTSKFVEFVTMFGSAVSASSSVRIGRQPKARDLRTLGIDPDQFRAIRDL